MLSLINNTPCNSYYYLIVFQDEDSDGEDCLMYLVKWKGYDTDESTWEPDDALEDPMVREKIRKFNRKQ